MPPAVTARVRPVGRSRCLDARAAAVGSAHTTRRGTRKCNVEEKKPKALTAVACTSSLDASTSAASSHTISKTQKRKLQKKKAKLAARAERAAEEQARAERKAKEKAERAENAPAASEPHPIPQPLAFAADEDDHCETAPEAYQDVAQILLLAAEQLGKTPASLRIYDPYYCNAAVVRHLGALGFSQVYNRNEDFYAALEAGSIPEHDIVVTNPPYSGAHPERLLRFLEQNGVVAGTDAELGV